MILAQRPIWAGEKNPFGGVLRQGFLKEAIYFHKVASLRSSREERNPFGGALREELVKEIIYFDKESSLRSS